VSIFDSVANEYDAGRPSHPPGVYDALEPLGGQVVLDVGAGTGIATAELSRRGACVVALDLGPEMLRAALQRCPGLAAMIADGARLPVGDGAVDLISFAQSWHWMKAGLRVVECARVLRPNGRWAAWWSHAAADGDSWFDRSWARIESVCPAVTRAQRTADWGSELADSGFFRLDQVVALRWQRTLTTADWLLDLRSRSYIEELPVQTRSEVMEDLRGIIEGAFPDGIAHIPYETSLWQARRTASSVVA
jgi:SAM-dependent methyltransferase